MDIDYTYLFTMLLILAAIVTVSGGIGACIATVVMHLRWRTFHDERMSTIIESRNQAWIDLRKLQRGPAVVPAPAFDINAYHRKGAINEQRTASV